MNAAVMSYIFHRAPSSRLLFYIASLYFFCILLLSAFISS